MTLLVHLFECISLIFQSLFENYQHHHRHRHRQFSSSHLQMKICCKRMCQTKAFTGAWKPSELIIISSLSITELANLLHSFLLLKSSFLRLCVENKTDFLFRWYKNTLSEHIFSVYHFHVIFVVFQQP